MRKVEVVLKGTEGVEVCGGGGGGGAGDDGEGEGIGEAGHLAQRLA